MSRTNRPQEGIFCPISEGHIGHVDTLLLPLGPDCLYARCHFHDWMRIELYRHGRKILFDEVSVVITPVELPRNSRGHYFELKKLPCVAAGEFPERKFRKKRENHESGASSNK